MAEPEQAPVVSAEAAAAPAVTEPEQAPVVSAEPVEAPAVAEPPPAEGEQQATA